jgi:hypothetical protein
MCPTSNTFSMWNNQKNFPEDKFTMTHRFILISWNYDPGPALPLAILAKTELKCDCLITHAS